MSVLTKGLAMDFVRQGRKEMAITSIWPAVVWGTLIRILYSRSSLLLTATQTVDRISRDGAHDGRGSLHQERPEEAGTYVPLLLTVSLM